MFHNVHIHTPSGNNDVLEIVNRYPYEDIDVPYFSTGIHPWHIDEDKLEEHFAIVEQRLSFSGCLAIGECGLDKRIEKPLDLQIRVFEKHLLLAKKHQKPVILHLVAAYQEVIEVCNHIQPGVPVIVHSFSKNIQVAQQLLSNGFYLSFGKYLLRNPELSGVFATIPLEKCFLETDSIEESITEVYTKAAAARNIEIEQMKDIISNNFKTVFKNG